MKHSSKRLDRCCGRHGSCNKLKSADERHIRIIRIATLKKRTKNTKRELGRMLRMAGYRTYPLSFFFLNFFSGCFLADRFVGKETHTVRFCFCLQYGAPFLHLRVSASFVCGSVRCFSFPAKPPSSAARDGINCA